MIDEEKTGVVHDTHYYVKPDKGIAITACGRVASELPNVTQSPQEVNCDICKNAMARELQNREKTLELRKKSGV